MKRLSNRTIVNVLGHTMEVERPATSEEVKLSRLGVAVDPLQRMVPATTVSLGCFLLSNTKPENGTIADIAAILSLFKKFQTADDSEGAELVLEDSEYERLEKVLHQFVASQTALNGAAILDAFTPTE